MAGFLCTSRVFAQKSSISESRGVLQRELVLEKKRSGVCAISARSLPKSHSQHAVQNIDFDLVPVVQVSSLRLAF